MSTETKEKLGEWMLPVEALRRFVPQETLSLSQIDGLDSEITRYGYKVSGHGFLVAQDMISEVVEDKIIFPMPKTSELLTGLMNLRGNLIPVFSLGKALNVMKSNSSIVLVLGEKGNEVALAVDEYPKPVTGKDSVNALPAYPEDIVPYMKPGTFFENMEWAELDCHAYFKSRAEAI